MCSELLVLLPLQGDRTADGGWGTSDRALWRDCALPAAACHFACVKLRCADAGVRPAT